MNDMKVSKGTEVPMGPGSSKQAESVAPYACYITHGYFSTERMEDEEWEEEDEEEEYEDEDEDDEGEESDEEQGT